jgi:hypothetical protein
LGRTCRGGTEVALFQNACFEPGFELPTHEG